MNYSFDTKQRPAEPARQVRPSNAFIEWTTQATASSIPHLFREQARKHPDRIAVKIGDFGATYKMLDSASNRVAQTILTGRESTNRAVGLLLGNEARVFEAILGVLKAGRFYVPLDPSYPGERNSYIAGDASADLILTNNENLHLADRLVQAGSQVINLDALDVDLPDKDPNLPTRADDFAFILYTSGSTGQPKGVIFTHCNVLHTTLRYTNAQHISSNDRLTLLTSYSYSASVGNLFGGLLNGAALCVFDIKREGLDKLPRFLIDEDISIYYSVPTLFRHLAGALTGDEQFPRLRLIRLGGEAVYRGDVELYKRHFHEDCLLHVGLGTTETGVVREYFFDKDIECNTEVTPVGYPVEDVDVLLLDAEGETVGFNTVGEIAVRSRYISPGYWRKPELTKAVFRPDPEDARSRIYLTGDLGRMLPDGCLTHIGRKDSQVKVRGFRVEASEVESALLNINGVMEVVVMAQEVNSSEKRLEAYVVLEKGSKLDPTELRGALRESLPDYMIPTAIRILDQLPRMPTGKLDLGQLQNLSLSTRAAQSDLVAPRNLVEARLKQLWEEVLHVRPVVVTDDFFELGGDSLAASEMFSEIAEIYGTEFPASTLLQASTIEQVARLIMIGVSEDSSLVPIQPSGSLPPFFCVHGIGGDVLSFRPLSKFLGDDQPMYGLRAGAGDRERFSVEEIAAQYSAEMQRLQPEGAYHLGGYSFGGIIAFEMARQLVEQGKTVGLLAIFDTYGPGYPKLLPVRARAAIHWKAFLRAELSEKLSYLRERVVINGIRIRKSARKLVYAYGRRAGRRPPAVGTKNLEATHQRALWGYTPKPYQGRVDLFRAINQKEIWHHDPVLGWAGLAGGGIRVHDIPGDHVSCIAEPNVCILAEHLERCLSRARQEAEPQSRRTELGQAQSHHN